MPETASEPKSFIFNEMSTVEVKQAQAYIVSQDMQSGWVCCPQQQWSRAC